jgi:hypothetical protein
VSSAWVAFRHDPREHPTLRAADVDREVVRAILSEAYADGRLAVVEHDDRTTSLWQARTLGELTPLIADLVPPAGPGPTKPGPAEPRASDPNRADPPRDVRRQLTGFLLPSLICVLLWARAAPHLFWPAWVMAYTGLPLLHTLTGRSAGHR